MDRDDAHRDAAPREDYPGPTESDEDETQPGRTPEMAEQEQAREERGTNEPA